MDKWDNKPSRKQHHRENPSFSSTLLDVIYRSIDEDPTEEKEEAQLIFYRETMRNQKQSNCFREEKPEAEKHNSRRARKVENWMEKKANEKVVMGRNSLILLFCMCNNRPCKVLRYYLIKFSFEKIF